MMKETDFWDIVEEVGWPEVHYDEAKYQFMRRHPPATAEEFENIFMRKKAELRKAGRVQAVCDSWDDNLAHIVGLGREEYERNIANPRLMFQREESLDYKESFAYCIPSPSDYGLLTDRGYDHFLRHIRELVERMDATDPDDVPPREYRQYPDLRRLAELFLARKWTEAIGLYHKQYGPGYADEFPTKIAGYGIPNLVHDLERYRLRDGGEEAPASDPGTAEAAAQPPEDRVSGENPKVTFTGENGNVFNLIAIARKALKAAGKHKEAKEVFGAVTKAGSYDEALRILGEYVDFD